MSKVAFKHIHQPSQQSLINSVSELMELAPLEADVLGKTCLLKLNAMSREVLPGRNTSPWFLEAVLENLRQRHPNLSIILADTDVAGYPQFEDACRNWGYNEIAGRFGLEIINLGRDQAIPVATGNPEVPEVHLPRTLERVDSIINLPVIKTHVLTGITCCLKNHWGLMPTFRYQHHVRVNQVIAEINRQVRKTVYNLVDGTVCIEGPGPKTGRPKVCSVVMAGVDRVALDSAVLDFMVLPKEIAPHVALAAERGVGSMEYEVVGDGFKPQPFERPQVSGDLVSKLERTLRGVPLVGGLFYHPWIAPFLGLVGTKYNELVWFRRFGLAFQADVLADSQYSPEFKPLIENS
jgi:uncharacterized protein (DUF362 family)